MTETKTTKKATLASVETLCNRLPKLTAEQLNKIIGCDDVDTANLSDSEKLSVLVYSELQKALRKKNIDLLLDCNFEKSKFHNSDDYKVDYYRLVDTTSQTSLIQFYVHASPAQKAVYFRMCTSCARKNRLQFEALENELQFKVKYDKKTKRAKTSERTRVMYGEAVNVVNSVLAILASTTSPEVKTDSDSDEQ